MDVASAGGSDGAGSEQREGTGAMTELTFAAGERATVDLRESAGEVLIQDRDEAVIRVATTGPSAPFVLREQETFRVRLDDGGTISVPAGLHVEVMAPDAVRLRVLRFGGETVLRAVPARSVVPGAVPVDGGTGEAGQRVQASEPSQEGDPSQEKDGVGAPDFSEFARLMADQGRRIFADVTQAVRAGGVVSEDVTRRVEEAAERIDRQARRAAERMQREVERSYRAAERAEEQARRTAGRAAEGVHRQAERAASRASRGRWWFTEKLDEWAAPSGDTPSGAAAKASPEERVAILQMLREGKITSEQAAQLLDALGG